MNNSNWLLMAACLFGCGDAGREPDDADLSAPDAAQFAASDGATAPARPDDGTSSGTTDAAVTPEDASASTGADAAVQPEPPAFQLDCGPSGIALESAGPARNRVNYVIVGDGYSEAELTTTYVQHLNEMMRLRFEPELEPYRRYRKFVNICALKVPSKTSGIRETAGDTAFGGYGNDQSRLGYVQDAKVRDAITRLLPASIEVDWVAIVLNSNRWWNAGGRYMVWSGAHKDAALAAMHEGGHSFQRLADEYGGACTFSGREADMRINVTRDATNTAGKWSKWLDFTHNPGTGKQGIFEGAQYCDKGAYRPSQDSVMNSLWRSSYFNAISLEQAVRLIYEIVRPIDEASPSDTKQPGVLSVTVVDPAVIQVEWSVDDVVVAKGPRFDVSSQMLAAGSHTVRARAFDDTAWVRGDRSKLEQSLSWTIEVP